MLLNHAPDAGPPERSEIGRGPRFFRLQAELPTSIAVDDASPGTLAKSLPEAAAQLLRTRDSELNEIVERLAR